MGGGSSVDLGVDCTSDGVVGGAVEVDYEGLRDDGSWGGDV